jgi:hypothetical protein
MPTTSRRFFNPHAVKHNLVDVSTVQSVTLRRNWTRLMGQGDNDITDSFQARTNLQVSGSLVIQDPIQADALLDAAEGALEWAGVPEEGGTAKAVSISGVSFFTSDETDSHNALDGVTLGWNAYSPTGVDPVTVGNPVTLRNADLVSAWDIARCLPQRRANHPNSTIGKRRG